MNNINCSHFAECSGCIKNEDVEKLEIFQQARSFFAEKNILNLQLHLGNVKGWRSRAKLATRGTFLKPLIGLFKAHSHDLIDIPLCRVHHPLINQACGILRSWIKKEQVEMYDEKTGKGLLRYVQLAVDRKKNKVQVCLVLNINSLFDFENLLIKSLWDFQNEMWHSIWINFNTRKDNVIFSETWKLLYGEKWLWESLAQKEICFHPASFVQANLEMFELLLKKLKYYVPFNSSLLDLYAGVGVIGLALVEQCSQICCVEINSLAESCFNQSRQRLPLDLQAKISFKTSTVDIQTNLFNDAFDVIVVDPPRKGLGKFVLDVLCHQNCKIKRLIYVSCGWTSFKRDCEVLLNQGWHLSFAETFLFFPGTHHLEILAVFDVMPKLTETRSKSNF